MAEEDREFIYTLNEVSAPGVARLLVGVLVECLGAFPTALMAARLDA